MMNAPAAKRMYTRVGASLRSALIAGFCIGIPAALPFWSVLLLRILPTDLAKIVAPVLPDRFSGWQVLAAIVGAGLWGLTLTYCTNDRPKWALAVAGATGMFIGMGLTFSTVLTRPGIFAQLRLWLPTHSAFAIFLLISVLVAITTTNMALGIASGINQKSWRIIAPLMLWGSLVPASAVITVDALLALSGQHVAAGGFAMVKLTAGGSLAATMADGAVVGYLFLQSSRSKHIQELL